MGFKYRLHFKQLLIHTSTAEVDKSCKLNHNPLPRNSTIIGEVEMSKMISNFFGCERMSVAALLSKWCPTLKSGVQH